MGRRGTQTLVCAAVAALSLFTRRRERCAGGHVQRLGAVAALRAGERSGAAHAVQGFGHHDRRRQRGSEQGLPRHGQPADGDGLGREAPRDQSPGRARRAGARPRRVARPGGAGAGDQLRGRRARRRGHRGHAGELRRRPPGHQRRRRQRDRRRGLRHPHGRQDDRDRRQDRDRRAVRDLRLPAPAADPEADREPEHLDVAEDQEPPPRQLGGDAALRRQQRGRHRREQRRERRRSSTSPPRARAPRATSR